MRRIQVNGRVDSYGEKGKARVWRDKRKKGAAAFMTQKQKWREMEKSAKARRAQQLEGYARESAIQDFLDRKQTP